MNQSPSESSPRSIGRMALAAVILLVAVYVLLKIVIGIVLAVALPVAALLAVVGLIWAYRVLF